MTIKIALLVSALLAFAAAEPATAGADTSALPMLIKANDLAEIESAGGTVSPRWVSYGTSSNSYTRTGPGTAVDTVTSYTELQAQFADRMLPGRYTWVLLDMEPWNLTPHSEYVDIPLYEQLSAEMVHAHGMKIMCSPLTKDYITDDVAGSAARYADAIDIQAQPWDGHVSTYKSLVDEAAKQARAANPNVLVGAGVATDSTGVPITGAQMYAAYESVRPVLDWYWLNAAVWSNGKGCAPDGCPDAAIDFLRLLSQGAT